MQSVQVSPVVLGMDCIYASKAACSDNPSRSRSTSAGSSRSQGQSSVDLQRNLYTTDALGLPEYDYPTPWSIEEGSQPVGSKYPDVLVVKNTFLGTNVKRPSSLEEFFEERGTQSCPASGLVGLPPGLEDLVKPEEAAARLAAAEAAYLRKAESSESTFIPSGLFEDSPILDTPGFFAAPDQQRQPVVLDLMQALSAPLEDHMQHQCAPAAYNTLVGRSAEAMLGSPECPTIGSQGHHIGACKPCAFLYTKGCSNGVNCSFCHLCEPGEKKRRAKESRAAQRSAAAMMRYSVH